jgi:hypothetical protein
VSPNERRGEMLAGNEKCIENLTRVRDHLGVRAIYDRINIKIGYSLGFGEGLVGAGWKQATMAGYVNTIINLQIPERKGRFLRPMNSRHFHKKLVN